MTTQPVAQFEGRYYERAADGSLYHAMTAKTGVAPGTDIGTTAPLSLYNPVGSGRDLVVVRGTLAYVSGTLGAGFMAWVGNDDPSAAAVSGTNIVEVPGRLGGAVGQGRALTTATLPATPKLIRPFCSLGAHLASTAIGPWQVVDEVDGDIVVPPGCAVSLEAVAAAGTSPLVVLGVSWYERATAA